MEYIYDADYLTLCTRYDPEEEEPLMTIYNNEWVRYPVYEFEIPNDTFPIRRQIVCIGQIWDREWLILGVCLWGNPGDLALIFQSHYERSIRYDDQIIAWTYYWNIKI